MSEALLELGALIALKQVDAVQSTEVAFGELTVTANLAHLTTLIEYLRDDSSCQFTSLVDITAVDHPQRVARFDVVYHFLSMQRNQRIRVKVAVREDEMVPSLVGLHPAANWEEREVFDMFGILFSGHPDLRRILTDYGFRGHPLRKDFPTTGYVEVRYDEVQKRVVYEPVKLVQEYRQFDFMSPWEGAEYILPGDQKAEAK
ncbi:NADH-quinone oxidoreductase subunit C [Xinfangfangia sp. CPCC 101601]|uniref:NADH-quinone oxidoreductase subunit C n=1 Tax=Pseudogemmobacter lacusdianii TaxID=3069608 RepID=A0ABU0VY69_9RHOB|nr:NADH-quinone oxidoreductase subunit C [Xinfangfangia sp. CPCC 101601]MDQ2066677.1 NADH-quinone oxidoreductase subunit C [Xinfangfangia sp. CPCC 101601]